MMPSAINRHQLDGAQAQPYSPFDHFAASVVPGNPNKGIMAMFALYFDDSGTHPDSNVAVAACYVSTVEQWKKLEVDWESVRRVHSFRTFHMSDAMAGHGEFEGWPKEKRKDLILRLIGLTRARRRMGSVIAVLKQDYDECVNGKLRQKLGKFHYSFAVRTCLTDVRRWREKFKINRPMQFVFDRMNKGGKGELITILENLADGDDGRRLGLYGGGGYSFQNRDELVPLQATDILANQGYQHMQNCFLSSNPQPHNRSGDYMKDLADGGMLSTGFWEKGVLSDLVARLSKQLDRVGWDSAPDLCL